MLSLVIDHIDKNNMFFIDQHDFVHYNTNTQVALNIVSDTGCDENSKIVLTNDKKFVYFTYSYYGKIKKYNVNEQKIYDFNDYVGAKITSILISDNDKYLYAGDLNGTITIFDLETETQIKSINAIGEEITGLLLSEDQASLFCIGSFMFRNFYHRTAKNTFCKVDIEKGTLNFDFMNDQDSKIMTMISHEHTSCKSTKKEHLYALKKNGDLSVVDAGSGKSIKKMGKLSQISQVLTVNPTNGDIYFVNNHNKIKVKNANKDNNVEEQQHFDLPEGVVGIKSMVISACGDYLFASDLDGRLLSFSTRTNKKIPSIEYKSNKPILVLAA